MRVDDRNLLGTTATGAGKAPESHRVERADDAVVAGSRRSAGFDRVELSTLSRALNAHDASRSQRGASLAQTYQSGRYTVDTAQVSRAMVSEGLAASAAKLP